ncbi:helix-turn-helix domain-containing protein [Bryobacter aggregatus]|uniref:helix-turn-helix domain-containing protein n=1 Tax=Bryobacter aggregatus TaxID=360054 RepID=UPI0004E1B90F|nr:helix-turn-helix domain-containing protein [Bryobacter aggregatus]
MDLSCQPTAALRPYIKSFWYSNRRVSTHLRELALPTGEMSLTIHLGGDPIRIFNGDQTHTFRHSVLWGAQSHYVVRDSSRLGPVLGVQFQPGGASAFLEIEHLTDSHTTHESLAPREQLLDCNTPIAAIQLLERHFLARSLRPLHPAIEHAIAALARGPKLTTIQSLERETGYSPKRFIHLFAQSTGLTPKRFSRIQRFQRVLKQIAAGQAIEWAQVALDSGYCDQSHLNRDFLHFAGITPTQYRPLRPDWHNHVAILS